MNIQQYTTSPMELPATKTPMRLQAVPSHHLVKSSFKNQQTVCLSSYIAHFSSDTCFSSDTAGLSSDTFDFLSQLTENHLKCQLCPLISQLFNLKSQQTVCLSSDIAHFSSDTVCFSSDTACLSSDTIGFSSYTDHLISDTIMGTA